MPAPDDFAPIRLRRQPHELRGPGHRGLRGPPLPLARGERLVLRPNVRASDPVVATLARDATEFAEGRLKLRLPALLAPPAEDDGTKIRARPPFVSDFHGYDAAYGARPLKRAIQRYLENPLAQEILAGRYAPGDTIVVDVGAGGELGFGNKSVASAKTAPEALGVGIRSARWWQGSRYLPRE
jgi:hypothetical protein